MQHIFWFLILSFISCAFCLSKCARMCVLCDVFFNYFVLFKQTKEKEFYFKKNHTKNSTNTRAIANSKSQRTIVSNKKSLNLLG